MKEGGKEVRAKGRHQGRFVALSGLRKLPGPPGSRYPIMIVDGDGLPVFHLSEWYRRTKMSDRDRTPDTYLAMLLPFTGFQLRHQYAWNAPPEQVCAHLVEFFREDVACQVSPSSKSDGYQVETTGHSPLSTSSLGVLLTALTSLYDVLKAAGYYPYTNPLRSESLLALKHEHLRGVQNAGAPDHAGIRSETRAESRNWPISTFHQKRGKAWEPDVVMEPEEIQQRMRDAVDFMITHASFLRDKVVLLLLRTTGARLSEILDLTAGGYRKESNVERALVTNKGSRGREEKTIYFTETITTALHKYIRTERARHDPSGRKRLAELEDTDPIFLTERGTPYAREAFYYHWNKLFKNAQAHDRNKHKPENNAIFSLIEFTPHDLRHLHVTRNMAKIEAKAKGDAGHRLL